MDPTHHTTRTGHPALHERSSCDASGFAQWFTPIRAFAAIFAILLVVIGTYVLIHLFRSEPDKPWRDGVVIAGDGSFRIELREARLEKFFAHQEIERLGQRLEAKCERLSADFLGKRRALLAGVQWQLREGLGDADVDGLSGILGDDPATTKDAAYREADLETVIAQIEDLRTRPGLSSDRARWLASAVRDLGALHARELAARRALADEVDGLEPQLYFLWAYHEKAGWILEVVVWSLIGCLCNTIIAMITACRSGDFRPVDFAMVFPKILLAPILAVVVVTWWSSGFSESSVSHLNLPYFIILSFALGFLTESIYARLRRIADALLGGAAAVADSRLASGDPGRGAYRYRYRAIDPGAALGPQDLGALSTQLKDYLKGTFERALITEAAKRP